VDRARGYPAALEKRSLGLYWVQETDLKCLQKGQSPAGVFSGMNETNAFGILNGH
jgi:hypothetical protein